MVHGCMVYTGLAQDGSSFMWHQPCQCCKYTTLVDISSKMHYKLKLVTHIESHASAASLLESGEQCYIKVIIIIIVVTIVTTKEVLH